MITVEQAIDIISQSSKSYGSETVPLLKAQGRILNQDIFADRDYPPFDRVTMDGIAINYIAYASGQITFAIESIAAAGAPFKTLKNELACIEVMTGAGMPKGCDTVIRYEDLDLDETKRTATLHEGLLVNEKQNVHFQGIDQSKSACLLSKGIVIRSTEIGIAASLGCASLEVKGVPRIAIISTGDELIDINETPLAHQIRKSNVFTIKSCLSAYGIVADLFHLDDDAEAIENRLAELLDEYDVLILSGGVSKGKYDYIPNALQNLGVTKHFHKIRQRPGKPFWFGRRGDQIVFALPGNPVSSFVCTKKYIDYWLRDSLEMPHQNMYAALAEPVNFKPDLHYFLEVKIVFQSDGKVLAYPKKGNGSGDFVNLKNANALIELPRGKSHFETGEVYPVLLI